MGGWRGKEAWDGAGVSRARRVRLRLRFGKELGHSSISGGNKFSTQVPRAGWLSGGQSGSGGRKARRSTSSPSHSGGSCKDELTQSQTPFTGQQVPRS